MQPVSSFIRPQPSCTAASQRQGRVNLCFGIIALFLAASCTVKTVGDPERPITIKAHVTIDVKGLQQTASNIEDTVSGGQQKR